jgi:hypothetical protein
VAGPIGCGWGGQTVSPSVVPPLPAEEPLAFSRLAFLTIAFVIAPVTVSGQGVDTSIAIAPRMAAAPPCVPDRSQLLDRPRREAVGPTALSLILPPFDNAPRIRNPVFVRMHVTVHGTVDSVVVTGISDSAYAARVGQSSMGMRFRPARRDGCLVADWIELRFEFPERR